MCLLASRITSLSEHPVLVQAGKVHGEKMAPIELILSGKQEEIEAPMVSILFSRKPYRLYFWKTVQSALSMEATMTHALGSKTSESHI